MYLNNKEERIIDGFLGNLDEFDQKEMLLMWKNKGMILARFDTCFDDYNDLEEDDADYEEFVSFVFEVLKVVGKPPVKIAKGGSFMVNYHDFPDVIMADGKKIN